MIVNESHVRALVREQIKNKLVLDSYSRACDEILEARQLNEFDLSSLASSAASFPTFGNPPAPRPLANSFPNKNKWIK